MWQHVDLARRKTKKQQQFAEIKMSGIVVVVLCCFTVAQSAL